MAASTSNLRVGFAGAGMMAEALAKGFAAANVASLSNMVATDINEARRNVFSAAGITIVDSSKEVPQPQRRTSCSALRSLRLIASPTAAAPEISICIPRSPDPSPWAALCHASADMFDNVPPDAHRRLSVQLVDKSDVLFLCVKPYGVKSLLQEAGRSPPPAALHVPCSSS